MQQSITFNTDEDVVGDVLMAIAYAYGYDAVEDALEEAQVEAAEEDEAEEEDEATAPAMTSRPFGWTGAKMRRYVTALQPTARTVLRAIAEGAPSITVDDAQAAAGLPAQVYGGAMSSFGFAARNVRGVASKPFTKVGRTYQIDPAVAQVAIEALDALGY